MDYNVKRIYLYLLSIKDSNRKKTLIGYGMTKHCWWAHFEWDAPDMTMGEEVKIFRKVL